MVESITNNNYIIKYNNMILFNIYLILSILLLSSCNTIAVMMGEGEGEAGGKRPPSLDDIYGKPPPLLQPIDYTTHVFPFGSPEKAVKLVGEMKQQWEGMDNPLTTPWTSVYTPGHDANVKSPQALVGTPQDPFTAQFGMWHHPPRAVPPPQTYDTFLFDNNNPFRRAWPKPKVGFEGIPARDRNPAYKKFWHPLLHQKPMESTNFPKVVVPVPRPIYRHRADTIPSTRPQDFVYEHIPPRAQVVPPRSVPWKKEKLVPDDYKYPAYNMLNPRNAFIRHSPNYNLHSAWGQMRYKEVANNDKALSSNQPSSSVSISSSSKQSTSPPIHDSLIETSEEEWPKPVLHKTNDNKRRFNRLSVPQASSNGIHTHNQNNDDPNLAFLEISSKVDEKVENKDTIQNKNTGPHPIPDTLYRSLLDRPVNYRFYPLGRKGPQLLRGPPTIKRSWRPPLFEAAYARWGARRGREMSVADHLYGDPPGPYGHGYNHQVIGHNTLPVVSEVTAKQVDGTQAHDEAHQVQDKDRQLNDPWKLHHDPRLPYIYTKGKQNAEDYKMAPEPPFHLNPQGAFVKASAPFKHSVKGKIIGEGGEAAEGAGEGSPLLWGAEDVAAQAGHDWLSPEVQPHDHAFNLPPPRLDPTRVTFQGKFPPLQAKLKYKDQYRPKHVMDGHQVKQQQQQKQQGAEAGAEAGAQSFIELENVRLTRRLDAEDRVRNQWKILAAEEKQKKHLSFDTELPTPVVGASSLMNNNNNGLLETNAKLLPGNSVLESDGPPLHENDEIDLSNPVGNPIADPKSLLDHDDVAPFHLTNHKNAADRVKKELELMEAEENNNNSENNKSENSKSETINGNKNEEKQNNEDDDLESEPATPAIDTTHQKENEEIKTKDRNNALAESSESTSETKQSQKDIADFINDMKKMDKSVKSSAEGASGEGTSATQMKKVDLKSIHRVHIPPTQLPGAPKKDIPDKPRSYKSLLQYQVSLNLHNKAAPKPRHYTMRVDPNLPQIASVGVEAAKLKIGIPHNAQKVDTNDELIKKIDNNNNNQDDKSKNQDDKNKTQDNKNKNQDNKNKNQDNKGKTSLIEESTITKATDGKSGGHIRKDPVNLEQEAEMKHSLTSHLSEKEKKEGKDISRAWWDKPSLLEENGKRFDPNGATGTRKNPFFETIGDKIKRQNDMAKGVADAEAAKIKGINNKPKPQVKPKFPQFRAVATGKAKSGKVPVQWHLQETEMSIPKESNIKSKPSAAPPKPPSFIDMGDALHIPMPGGIAGLRPANAKHPANTKSNSNINNNINSNGGSLIAESSTIKPSVTRVSPLQTISQSPSMSSQSIPSPFNQQLLPKQAPNMQQTMQQNMPAAPPNPPSFISEHSNIVNHNQMPNVPSMPPSHMAMFQEPPGASASSPPILDKNFDEGQYLLDSLKQYPNTPSHLPEQSTPSAPSFLASNSVINDANTGSTSTSTTTGNTVMGMSDQNQQMTAHVGIQTQPASFQPFSSPVPGMSNSNMGYGSPTTSTGSTLQERIMQGHQQVYNRALANTQPRFMQMGNTMIPTNRGTPGGTNVIIVTPGNQNNNKVATPYQGLPPIILA